MLVFPKLKIKCQLYYITLQLKWTGFSQDTTSQCHPRSSLLESDKNPLLLGIDSKNKSFQDVHCGSHSYSSSPIPCGDLLLDRVPYNRPS